MHRDVRRWTRIRSRILLDKWSKRRVIREYGISWSTLKKMLAFSFPPDHKRKQPRKPTDCTLRIRSSHADQEQLCLDILSYLANATNGDMRSILSAVSSLNPRQASTSSLVMLRERLQAEGFGTTSLSHRHSVDIAVRDWIVRVMQGEHGLPEIRTEVGDVPKLEMLLEKAKNGTLKERNRALSVLTRLRKIPIRVAARCLRVSYNSIAKHWNVYLQQGVQSLFVSYHSARIPKSQEESVKMAVFTVLHSPPKIFNINRTTWKMCDLQKCIAQNGMHLSREVIRTVIKSAGYKWRHAKIVLTSTDPEYREKLKRIQEILSNLKDDERFFSIDEFGPFAVKAKGGRKLVAPNEYPSVPQRQKSKGWLIITAALELSRNQVTHFYSRKKDTEEMIKLLYKLLEEHKACSKIYLSWDAASWHASKLLYKIVEQVNSTPYRREHGTAFVELAPLPASAQFLNVIESVFSGMAKAIIHNSDYAIVDDAITAIDRYFLERNAWFQKHPKRAGKKIWGNELVPAVFDETQNCKDARWSNSRR
jgi:hypothetical protein